MESLDMPALSGFGDAAGQRPINIGRFGKNSSRDAGGLLFKDGSAFDGRELRQFLTEGCSIDAAGAQGNSAGPFGFLTELLGRAVGHDLAAIDDNGARARGIDFFENVGRENYR